MTELRLSDRTDSVSVAEKPRRFLWILLATTLVVVAAVFAGIRLASYYSQSFGDVDHSVDSFEVTSLAPIPVSTGSATVYKISFESTYRNTKRGVILKLPGTWRILKDSAVPDPPPQKRFCVLASQDGLDVMFWPIFPDLLPTLDADSEAMRKKFAAGGTFTLKSQRKLQVRGREALELQFSTSYGDLHLLIVRKWPTVYALAIFGSAKSDADWKVVEDALANAIEVR